MKIGAFLIEPDIIEINFILSFVLLCQFGKYEAVETYKHDHNPLTDILL